MTMQTYTTRAYKPQHILVGAESIMILPPVYKLCQKLAVDYKQNTAFAQGSIVRGVGAYYWAAIGGTTDAAGTPPDHAEADGDQVDGTVTWRMVRPSRQVVSLTNVSNNTISVARGFSAVLNSGITLSPGASVNEGYTMPPSPYQGAWYAIASGGDSQLSISEG